ncbi:MAG: hypothetical protein IJU40_08035 [Desulfovibrionaceae bacterium]|nr:hypothetical protein [Desulfovibrionaceae bacterium]
MFYLKSLPSYFRAFLSYPLTLVLILILVSLLQACEDDKRIYLYDQFYYAMPRAEVEELAIVSPCQDKPSTLCRHNPVPFFRESWYQRFIFRKDRLVGVQLIHLDPKKASKLVDSWLDAGYRYMPVALISAGQELDLFAEIKVAGKEAARQAVERFVRQTANDRESIFLYLDLDKREDLLDSYYNFHTILANAPRDIIGIEESIDEKYLTINFIAPVAEWQDRGDPRP